VTPSWPNAEETAVTAAEEQRSARKILERFWLFIRSTISVRGKMGYLSPEGTVLPVIRPDSDVAMSETRPHNRNFPKHHSDLPIFTQFRAWSSTVQPHLEQICRIGYPPPRLHWYLDVRPIEKAAELQADLC
jgi:hypothetical protein